MRIINIIDRFDKVNFGIWNAAISTASILKEKYRVESELWFPESAFNADTYGKLVSYNLANTSVDKLITERKLTPENDIIVTHGCWQYPTKWGYEFKKHGFRWVYVPHGMLEPWSMQQKWLQKKLYYLLVEGRLSRWADSVRAVGSPEFKNLKNEYGNVCLIPNGTKISSYIPKEGNVIKFLFMARLHYKKGILPLVRAWQNSLLNNSPKFKLIIAGPDDGELTALESEIIESVNIEYVGAIYGAEKEYLLQQSHFYVLPSLSEGFPTSVVEAMQYGLVPIISEGCNFPEAFEYNLALKTAPFEYQILQSLNHTLEITDKQLSLFSLKCHAFIEENYSIERIAELQYELYNSLL